ncbi:phytanoyl-CoA dioxygenase family protein [Phenylobacterium sp.]|uniref:phytanoyl-CoA dioxygenase family protein n=1 Tax=Phenylobacterium sp. TaxID=1871053 RepID=UPI0025DD519B|nr:phytanoyl-CoA dioxygenase family protein [Phenylobacterium sp.]MBX3484332.1 phytanoyl-CoA dioxygenase family protein [Phenylobacterium sp.]MCW5760934.1 phytanoyl-CoA dioxygenase family protein [Phenylobacterium sp.]
MTPQQLQDLAEAYRRDGFVHAKGLIPAGEIAALTPAVDEAVATRKGRDTRALSEKTPYEQSFIQCQYIWEDFPGVRGLTFHQNLGEALGALLGAGKVRLWHDQALYKEAGGRETEAHQDHAYWPIAEADTITAWIPLTPVDEVTGCMGYVPGSHQADLEFVDIFRAQGQGEALVARQAADPVFCPAEPGDVLFHSGRTVHMARPNRSDRMRRAYTAIYFKDGCTRGGDRPHPSVDRDRIPQGGRIAGGATPVAWPLADGRFPEPQPWPESQDERFLRSRAMGTIPGR